MKRKERTPLQALRLAHRPPTLVELAEEMGYTHGHLSRFEAGLVPEPTETFLIAYVNAMRKFGIRTTRAEVLRAHAVTIRSPSRRRPPAGDKFVLDVPERAAR